MLHRLGLCDNGVFTTSILSMDELCSTVEQLKENSAAECEDIKEGTPVPTAVETAASLKAV